MRSIIVSFLAFILICGSLRAQENLFYYKGQLVNQVDENNSKFGHWVLFYDAEKTMPSKEGEYIDNQMEGEWIEYYKNGNIKSRISYKKNKMDGPVTMYFEDGSICEEGTWRNAHWIGSYKYYHAATGKLAYDWFYDSEGKRTGEQKYFYETGKLKVSGFWEHGVVEGICTEYYPNGKVRIETPWKNGKTNGIMKEYYENGALRYEKYFDNGVYNPTLSVSYDKQTPTKPNKPTEVVVKANDNKPSKSDIGLFSGTGYHKMYNSGLLEREGMFNNGVFISGKRYYYNNRGELIKTAVYQNGRIVEVIEK